MEEILASIRRIIEDSDTGKSVLDTSFPAAANSSAPRMGAADVDMFRKELRTPAGDDDTPAAEDTPIAGSGAAAATPTVSPVNRTPPAPDTDLVPRVERKLQTARVEPAAPAPVQEDWKQRLAAPAAAAAPVPASPAPAPARATPVAQSPAEPKPVAQEPSAEAATTLPEAPRPAIISEVAGRQVAAAFGELSDVFAASRRRSFDEVAEEMMRPMLQDWLDNNLPTLVERLVREEIERVARGTAR